MSVKIYIRDNTNGNIHEYGTNQHDALILQDDGSLHYQNLQNGCGTMFPDEGYTFCEADGSDPRTSDDYIQYGVEPYIDIGGNGEDHTAKTYAQDFFEKLPNARKSSTGIPAFGCRGLAYGTECKHTDVHRVPDCDACWNEKMEK